MNDADMTRNETNKSGVKSGGRLGGRISSYRYDEDDCTDCEGSGITHQTEKYCTCDAGIRLNRGNAVTEKLYDQSYIDAIADTLNAKIARLEKACAEWCEVSQNDYQLAKAAEAKLAKAVEMLGKFCAHYPMGINPYLDDAYINARAALAELEAKP